jgi:hypothetical protein
MPKLRSEETGQYVANGGRVRPPSSNDWRTKAVASSDSDDEELVPVGAVVSDGSARGNAIAARAADRQRAAEAKATAKAQRRAARRTRTGTGRPETPSDTRQLDLRERGYEGPVDQDGYATTEAEFMARYERDKAKAERDRFGPGEADTEGGPCHRDQRLAETEAAYQAEKAKGDKLRAKWGQATDPSPDRPAPAPAPQRRTRSEAQDDVVAGRADDARKKARAAREANRRRKRAKLKASGGGGGAKPVGGLADKAARGLVGTIVGQVRSLGREPLQ